jgi:putative transferase (TIGR04331 family)
MFLVTTADQRFWKTDEKILFLGEWCRLYDQKSVWSQLDCDVLPHHWGNNDQFNQDFEALPALREKVLLHLVPTMNELHGVDYSTRYWRIVLGAWLFQFIDIFYDRYKSIFEATRSGKVTHTWVPSLEPSECVPKDFVTFDQWCIQDSYNQVIYGWIIRQLKQISYEIKGGIEKISIYENVAPGPDLKWKNVLVKILGRFSRCVPDALNGVVFYASFIKPWELVRLQLTLGQMPYLRGPEVAVRDFPVNYEKRKLIQLSFATSSFETLLQKIIPAQIPKIYIEGYADMGRRSLEAFPKSPKVVFTSVGLYAHEGFKFWAAKQVEQGVRLVVSQHGGAYGSSRVYMLEEFEVDCSDHYFSWGWQDNNSPKIIPMPSGQLERVRKTIKPDPAGSILMMGWELPRYFWLGYSAPVSSKMIGFFADHEQFVAGLSKEARKLLVLRLYQFDQGWGVDERWRKFDPTISTSRGGNSIYRQLNKSRLAVNTYNSTVHLETLSANFPTLFFWRPDSFELRNSAQPDYDELLEVGIFHRSPESAAAKVNEIFQDPLAWWYSSHVQEIREKFCRNYAWTKKTWCMDWKNKFKNIVGA